ncbi:MMPL family transporter [soil metagenome]
MAGIFLSIFHFLSRSKARFAIIMLLVFAPMVYLALQLRLEEDITKMMPDDRKIEKLSEIMQSSKFTDRLVFNIYLADSTTTDPDKLIAFADQLADSLKLLQPTLIDDITYQVGTDSMMAIYGTIYENLPLFLDDADYAKMEEMFSDSAMERIVNRNFRTLMSPASAMLKKNVLNDPLGLTPMGLLKLQQMQFSDNYQMYNSHVFTKDSRNLLFFVTPTHGSSETGQNKALIDSIDSHIASVQADSADVVVEYFGPAAIAVANAGRMKQDIQTTTGVASIILIIAIYWLYRRKSIFLLIFLPVAGGGLFAAAMMFILKTKVSAIALGVASMLLGITIDYSIHTITHFRKVTSPRQLIYDIANPILICSITTIGTLLGLLFVKAEALREMGMFAAFSVLGAAVFTITLLPVLLSWAKTNDEATDPSAPQMEKMERWLAYPMHKLKWFIALVFVLFFASAFWADKVGFETDLNKMNYMPHHLQEAEDHLDAINNYRLKNIYLVAEGKDLETALHASEQAEQELQKLKANNVVQQYTTVSLLLMSQGRQQQKIDRWNTFWTPERKAYVQEKLTQYSTPLGFKAEAFSPFYVWINKDFAPIDNIALQNITDLMLKDYISEGKNGVSIVSLVRVDEKDKSQIYNLFENSEQILVFDKKYLTEKLVTLIKQDFDLLVNFSFFAVLIILIIAYGDLLIAFIVMLPVIISWYFTLGVMAATGSHFNIINIVISTFLYGVGIDYSVFVMRGLLQDYREGINHLPTYKTSVVASAFTTIIGVGALFFAVHPALRSIALSVVLGSISVVILSFTIVPAAFYWLIKDTKGNLRKEPLTLVIILRTFFLYLVLALGSLLAPIFGLVIFIMVFIPMKYRKLAFHYIIFAWGRIYLATVFTGKYQVRNPHGETFTKPAVIIANHLSLLDTPVMLRMHPKLVILTNDWVRRSPLFGFATRLSDMYSVSSGIDIILPDLQKLVDQGYSIVVFPEGTRSPDGEVHRFHKGAFYIAEQLKVDILPVFIQGTRYVLGKGDFWGNIHTASIQINKRIVPSDTSFGDNYTEKSKAIRKYYQRELPAFYKEVEDAAYMKHLLKANYRYKGFKVEWQLRQALRKEHGFQYLHNLIPADAKVAIVGAGYGYSAYMLGLLSPSRSIDAFETDEEKRLIAIHGVYNENLIHFLPMEQLGDGSNYDSIVLEHIVPVAVLELLKYLKPDGQLFVAGRYFKTMGSDVLKSLPLGFAGEVLEPSPGYFILVVKYIGSK